MCSGLYGQEVHKCPSHLDSEFSPYHGWDYADIVKHERELLAQTRSVENTWDDDCIITIPVHIIVLHDRNEDVGTGFNISEEHILSQLQVLNEDFGRTNSDASLTPVNFSAVNTGIQFQLASRDPDGRTTNGISRLYNRDVFRTNLDQNTTVRKNIKSRTEWDPSRYLNVWVVPRMTDGVVGLANIASVESIKDEQDDGIFILTDVFGGSGYGKIEKFDLGRTLVHEVGHYLGLYHIFNLFNCSRGDFVEDTPQQYGPTSGCPSGNNPSCGNQGDMYMNYMDYTDDGCMNAFTQGQAERMHLVLNGARSSLLTSGREALKGVVDYPIDVIVQINHPSCIGGSDASITLWGNACDIDSFSYSIDGTTFNNQQIHSGLRAGSYTYYARDLYGNQKDTTIQITDPSKINFSIIRLTEVSCAGAEDASISLEAEGGYGNFTYFLNNNRVTTPSLVDELSAGNYIAVAEDEEGCRSTFSFIIEEPEAPTLDILSGQTLLCHNSTDGKIEVSASGDSGPFLYSANGVDFSATGILEKLSVGENEVYVKNKNGCVSSHLVTIESPQAITSDYIVLKDALCADSQDGSVELSVNGGAGSYTFSSDDNTYTSGNIISGLPAGMSDLYIQDVNGCKEKIEVTLSSPESLQIEIVDINDNLCFNDTEGSVVITTSGTTGSLSYFINGTSNQSESFSSLGSGIHEITVIDEIGCSAALDIEIKSIPQFEVNHNTLQVPLCHYSDEGSILLLPANQDETYTYSIDDNTYSEDPVFNQLTGGLHSFFIKETSGCVVKKDIMIESPEALGLVIDEKEDPVCASDINGVLRGDSKGGTGNRSLTFNGENIDVIDFDALSAGNYILEIRDANGCYFDTLMILETSDPIDLSIESIDQADCVLQTLGSASLSASGGDGILTYRIGSIENNTGVFSDLAGGDYRVEVEDERGCILNDRIEIPTLGKLDISIQRVTAPLCYDSSNGKIELSASGGTGILKYTLDQETNEEGTFSGLSAGAYKIYVEDTSTCRSDITIQVTAPKKLDTAFVERIIPLCNLSEEGIITVNGTGGRGRIIYSDGTASSSSGRFSGYGAGDYIITLKDENDCEESYEVSLSAPLPLEIDDLQLNSPSCYMDENGSISFSLKGGTGDKTIRYRGSDFVNTFSIKDVKSASYSFEASDENGCEERFDFFLDQADPLEVLAINETESTQTRGGSISPDITGGVRPYKYAIDNGPSTDEATIKDISTGEHLLSIEDANGCTFSYPFTITLNDDATNPPGSVSDVYITVANYGFTSNIHFQAHGDQLIKVYVFDMQGKYVYTDEVYVIDGRVQMDMNTEDFAAGTYVLRIVAEREYELHKFIKY